MVQRLLLGKYNDGTTYGARMSVPGANVLTATGENLIFDTQWIGAGTIHVTGVTTIGTTISFPTMNYIPMVFAVAYNGSSTIDPFWTNQYPDNYRWANNYTTRIASGVPFRVTTSQLQFFSTPSGFTQHYTNVRYYIFRVQGS
jgi:hypothetical protein